jgi:hypothetical protein
MGAMRWMLAAAGIGVVAGALGCTGELRARDDRYYDRRPYVGAPPPRAVYVTPAAPAYPPPAPVYAPPPQQVVVVREAPPAPRFERPGPMPGVGFVWVNGYWVRQGPQWAWVPGHWDRPPRAGARWEEPRWERSGVEFRFRAGGWR